MHLFFDARKSKFACAIPHRDYKRLRRVQSLRKVVKQNEKNISAKEKTCTEGTRLQKENVNKERQKGTCPPSC